MGTQLKITGAVDRREPDPTAPIDQNRAFIGMVAVEWTIDRPHRAMAAIIKVATGGGVMFPNWGPHVPCLNWIGDAPDPAIARAVYDAIRDRGPYMGEVAMRIEATDAMPELGVSYRRAS